MRFQIIFALAATCSTCFASPEQQHPITGTSGISQPLIGFGTWNLKESPQNTSDAVSLAIQAGYRQIDGAAAYGNEKDVGKGIADGLKKAGLKREDIWVTSKLWNDHHAPDLVEKGFNKTLDDLGVGYLDLYLIHWPVGKSYNEQKYHYDYVSTWHALEKLPKSRVRNIGISNFSPAQLKYLIKRSETKPAVHQFELHPYLQQTEWIKWHKDNGISVTAYSPLGNTNPTYRPTDPPALLQNDVISDIAKKHNATAAQIALAWGIGRGTSVIPKSKHEVWIRENLAAKDVHLDKEDRLKIKGVGEKWLTRFNNPSKGWGVSLFEGLDGV